MGVKLVREILVEHNIIITLVFAAVILIPLSKSLLQVQENERVVVLRFGKFEKILNPGLNFIVPFTDIPIVVDLTKHLTGWQTMKMEDVNDYIKELVLNNPDPTRYK